jgi:hypothetical protein
MRAPVVILLLLVLAAAAWWSFRDGGEPALPSQPRVVPSPTPAPIAPAEQGGRVSTPAPVPAPPPADAEPTPTPPPSDTAPPPAPANVVLAVRGLATRAPVASFRWRFQNTRGTARGDGADGRAELVLEPAAVGELLVEADGFAPFTRPGVAVPEPPAPPLQLDVFLGPAVPAAGITLFVRDLALQPIANVRVDAFALRPDATATPLGATTWHLGTPLWARRAGAADGRYALPQLPPGEYGIRVAATDADGALLPLLPFRRTFALTGDNGFVEDVPLAPGALLSLELVDAAGAPLDPARVGTTMLQLSLPGGPPVARKWSVRSGSADATAVDVVPGVGKVALADAVEAGQYQLEVRIGGNVRAQRQLFLRPGVTTEERVVVP